MNKQQTKVSNKQTNKQQTKVFKVYTLVNQMFCTILSFQSGAMVNLSKPIGDHSTTTNEPFLGLHLTNESLLGLHPPQVSVAGRAKTTSGVKCKVSNAGRAKTTSISSNISSDGDGDSVSDGYRARSQSLSDYPPLSCDRGPRRSPH